MQIAAWISHPGSSTPIHYLNVKVNAFIFSTGMVPPAQPPPWWPAGRSFWQGDCLVQPWQGREGSHPFCGGATSTPGDKVQRLMNKVELGTRDMTLHSLSALPCTGTQGLVWWSQSPAMVDCKGHGRKRPCVCAGTSAGASSIMIGQEE